jgi:hypothetical protein
MKRELRFSVFFSDRKGNVRQHEGIWAKTDAVRIAEGWQADGFASWLVEVAP